MRTILILMSVLCLSACEKVPQKTESMLRLESVKREQKDLVDRAFAVWENEVGEDPLSRLPQLQYAKEITQDAARVFANANITGIEQPRLQELENRFDALRPALAEYAFDLLSNVAGQTIALREQISEIKSQSYAASKEQDIESVVAHIAEKYNQSIKDCCLNELMLVNGLLRQENSDVYKELRITIYNVITHQEEILDEAARGEAYLKELAALRSQLDAIDAI
jgi:hypothetical protein